MRWVMQSCPVCEANLGCPTHPVQGRTLVVNGTAQTQEESFIKACGCRVAAGKLAFVCNACAIKRYMSPEGLKYDEGKPDHTYISNDLLDGLAAVRAYGDKKYTKDGVPGRDNWRKGFKFNRSIAASLRHINAFKEGEDLDKESGLCHILHAVACLEHLLGDYLHRPQNDDRYKLVKSNGAGNKE